MKPPLRWQIGDVRVTRIQEIEAPGINFFLPDATPENLAPIEWLAPHFLDRKGRALSSIHALVVEAPGATVVVDTCVGNDKPRALPFWNELQTSFLQDFEAAGFALDAVDAVVCTHLHTDHIGWNTRLVDGQWVPTFPKARYLIAEREWAHWTGPGSDDNVQQELSDSVRPVIDAGLAQWVQTDHAICDEVRLEPTPGHTPGHVSVCIESHGQRAVITGDLVHHPCQLARPQWHVHVDNDQAQARATRDAFFARYADTPTLIIGTHFCGPTAGHIKRDGDVYRLHCD